ncbi:diacylglycerol kinase [Pseudoalteromonas sp. HM-SA03]|uniref:diacylglycerol kinase n=1 Tax=Pseudoalteromonas sp. HM-SA03 TaxID=2029678 RepID=UPI0020D02AF6|nr:diacylglycerol kinase [Pseudoalteromonas sp. HM-SA03]
MATFLRFSLILFVCFFQRFMLFCATLFVMFAEIVYSAIEATIDRVGLEIHPLSGLAKDLGSAGVLIALIVFICIWGSCLYQNLY